MNDFSNALAQRMSLVTAPGTSSVRSKANALRAHGVEVHNFAAGELYVDADEAMKRHAIRAVEEGRNKYTPPLGMPELRERLAERLSQRIGLGYAPSEVAVTSGAKQALFNTALLLLNPGDEALIPSPYWETFPTQIRLAGGTPVPVDTSRTQFRPTVRGLEAARTERTRMLVVNTPNNPTGVVYDAVLLRDIGSWAGQHGLWVVFDECYGELVRPEHKHQNVVALCPELKEQAIVVNSFSKSHAVTGWRIGYVAAPQHVITGMHNLQGHTTSNPSTLSQWAAHGVLEEKDGQFLAAVNAFLQAQLELALSIASEIQDVDLAPAEGAFYLYFQVPRKIGGSYGHQTVGSVDQLAELLLTEAHSAVVPGSVFGDPFGFRITYSLEPQALEAGLVKIRDVLNAIRSPAEGQRDRGARNALGGGRNGKPWTVAPAHATRAQSQSPALRD